MLGAAYCLKQAAHVRSVITEEHDGSVLILELRDEFGKWLIQVVYDFMSAFMHVKEVNEEDFSLILIGLPELSSVVHSMLESVSLVDAPSDS